MVQLHAVHDLGGGIAGWLESFCRADTERVNLVLKPYSISHAYAEGLMLYAADDLVQPLRMRPFARPISATALSHDEYREAVADIVRDFNVQAVLVSSFIGHALDILTTGLPTLVINHDFYPTCPAINLYFREVCRSCDAARLTDCATRNTDFNSPYRVFPVAHRLSIRAGLISRVLSNPVTMVVPTDSTRRHLLEITPELRDVRFEVIPHGNLPILRAVPPPSRGREARLRILILGIQSVTKGMNLLFEVLQELSGFADIYLVGAQEAGELFRYRHGVHVVDHYAMDALPVIVEEIAPDLGLLMSTWPETFSYTLSELMQMRVPPVATRIGAFADRIRDGENGILFEPNPVALLDCLRGIDVNRNRLTEIRWQLEREPERSLQAMVADYHHLLPCPVPAIGSGTGQVMSEASSALAVATLAAVREWKAVRGLGVRIDMKEGRLREVCAEVENLRRDMERLRRDLEHRDHLIAEILASTTWRVSGPVRWFGRMLKRILRKS